MKPGYVPRDFARTPRLFGAHLDIAWKTATSRREAVQIRASQLQHQVAVAVRAMRTEQQLTQKALADNSGMTELRLGRLLRGEQPMRLEDVAILELTLGINLVGVTAPR
ncbi:helix-turn-helix domain-containing protein [Georgenia yuyongxinii]|uniref:Helix-turn-helix transcriptional regulator n=1 Tax=Georgenia yuyongxinii TaxID=2589797 RepID=A0A552WNR1_9MICO|nr:helix-turn-helix transcriptional regulator [Georgenia yuyongxinii]TRW44390.1 helix-turn-helix transcriptional regulator [Georgenia yuyongxinii]